MKHLILGKRCMHQAIHYITNILSTTILNLDSFPCEAILVTSLLFKNDRSLRIKEFGNIS